jgi:hypothetical protein
LRDRPRFCRNEEAVKIRRVIVANAVLGGIYFQPVS